MSTIGKSGEPQTRRYTPAEKDQAVRMVRALRAEFGTSRGTVKRVAEQLGYGVESVRLWVKQAAIDTGERPHWSGLPRRAISTDPGRFCRRTTARPPRAPGRD